MKHINPELIEKIRELALKGTTTREIAEQLFISESQAYSILKGLDIEAPWKVRRAKREAARAVEKAAAAAKVAAAVIQPSYLFTGVSRNLSTSAKATISSNFFRISAFVIPKIAPLRKIFSLPVSSG